MTSRTRDSMREMRMRVCMACVWRETRIRERRARETRIRERNSPMAHRMHHRPPGNVNYAGMLVIWDRLFGTYAAEEVRKDLYGLAKQPNTFDPLALNLAHVRKMLAAPDGGGLRRLLFGRRVPARWQCSLRALFEPIPPVRVDARADGPVRTKWDGDSTQPRGGVLADCWLVLVTVACTACSNKLLISARSMPLLRALAGGVASAATWSALGQACDRRRPRAQVAFALSAPAIATLAACVWA